ncbi:protein-glutamine glutaminase family protein [Bdellovibrio sp. GT3]|uniref:protein-glutamine glutaminase family protein n=1 Tax=Bdellovibrio sp. GT3 TaxID=3136282 RepID=UPI0030F2FBC2
MRHLGIIVFLISTVGSTAFAGLSASRLANESYQSAKIRSRIGTFALADQDFFSSSNSPESLSKPLSQLDISKIPDVGSYEDLLANFKFIRDSYFMKDGQTPRRLTWLYPDDGCYARAELAAEKLIEIKKSTPKKVFAFGSLLAQTKNSPYGHVEWWYHVAVVYRVQGTAYVLDPALNPQQPMTLKQWDVAIGGRNTNINYSICSKDTFDPDDICTNPNPVNEDFAAKEQSYFFPDEWNRLLELGRNPEQELGNRPPWL